MKITSKSQIKDNQKFNLKLFKKPFCFHEKKKKYKPFEMPNFKSNFFLNKSKSFQKLGKILFISGPARNGNHLLLTLLDNHPNVRNEIGEDNLLRTTFTFAKRNENEFIKKIKNGDIEFILKMSGAPRLGKYNGINKWKILDHMYKNNIKSKIWSGHEKESYPHITDFQDIIPKINYQAFESYLKSNKDEIKKVKTFMDFFSIYIKAKNKLIDKKKKNFKFNYRWTGSGLRRELIHLLKNNRNILCLTPIRRFENFYYSYAKTRHYTNKITQSALNDLWEHWRHKVIDYLILKQKYPKNIIIVKFEDIVTNPKRFAKKLCKALNIPYSSKMIIPSLLGESTLGNSSFKKKNIDKGKIYKSSINRKLNSVEMPKEYKEILKHIDKYSLKV
tara:strand:- start:4584 stop:5750 length:1167 start_codon:yes stop_codon:yes gene_type:complete